MVKKLPKPVIKALVDTLGAKNNDEYAIGKADQQGRYLELSRTAQLFSVKDYIIEMSPTKDLSAIMTQTSSQHDWRRLLHQSEISAVSKLEFDKDVDCEKQETLKADLKKLPEYLCGITILAGSSNTKEGSMTSLSGNFPMIFCIC